MHVKCSVSLINILTKLIFPISSYHQPKIKSKSFSTWMHHTGSVHMKCLFILSFILIISWWKIIREKEERANRKAGGEVGVIILLPVYLGRGGAYKRGELNRGFTVSSDLSRELFRIQSELKTDQITPKQVGDLRALLTARKSKGKVILTMTINAKSQWQCSGRRSRKRMLHQRQMRKSVITIVRRFIQVTRCLLHGR